ncbi:MAG: hypothetical protein JWQ40_3682 [Segetibacter sp.]|nr:hypothetical protein [Segetibacter sp.]
MHLPAFYITLIIAFTFAVATYKNIRPDYLKLSLPYLFINLVAETYGTITKINGIRNVWIYNIATTIEFAFYYYIYFRALKGRFAKKTIFLFSFLYFPFAIFNIIYIQGINHFHTNGFLIGALFLILLVFAYLQELMQTSLTYSPLKEKMLWISIGVILFYIVSFFYLGLFEFIDKNYPHLENIFDQILNILNVFLYLMFIIAFYIKNDK